MYIIVYRWYSITFLSGVYYCVQMIFHNLFEWCILLCTDAMAEKMTSTWQQGTRVLWLSEEVYCLMAASSVKSPHISSPPFTTMEHHSTGEHLSPLCRQSKCSILYLHYIHFTYICSYIGFWMITAECQNEIALIFFPAFLSITNVKWSRLFLSGYKQIYGCKFIVCISCYFLPNTLSIHYLSIANHLWIIVYLHVYS